MISVVRLDGLAAAERPDGTAEGASAARGLSEADALDRRARGLGNTMPPPTGRTYAQIVRENAFTFINGTIALLCLALALLGQWSDALLSVGVVALNVLVSLAQEARAKQVLDRVALLTRPTATVVREGVERVVDPAEIVRGDVLVVRPGDQILVDGRLVETRGLDVDESLLSGESDLTTKANGDPVLAGSFCVNGSARFEAERVGEANSANRLTRDARAFRRVYTPLQREVNVVVRIILLVAFAFAVLLVSRAALAGAPAVDVVRISVVIVGLVPNGLFLAIAAAYAMGAVRIAGKGALIQQANAVESLSNVDVLCLDKTGTLTTGRLVVERVLPFDVDPADARALLGDHVASASGGNRTSAAIAAAAPGRRRAIRAETPFSSERKWGALTFDDAERRGSSVLGAPDVMLARLAPGRAAAVGAALTAPTEAGLRVLLLARGPSAGGDPGTLPDGLVPVALVTLRDELRPDARETLARFAAAGIALKLISGDHRETVRRLALQAGLATDGRVVSGEELEAAGPEELGDLVAATAIFARVTPQQKERIVEALRARGRYVAMIGDGVNDVLALKRADLAIALQAGSQAARAVADLVLLQDTFTVLPLAFREGQRIIQGMQQILRLFLTRVTYVALLITAVALVDAGFPYTPKQNALLTLLTVGVPSIGLAAFARPAPPRRDGLMRSLSGFVLPAAWSFAPLGLGVYLVGHGVGGEDLGRAALTMLSIACGLLLVVFAGPPSPRWAGPDAAIVGRRSALLVLALLAAFGWVVLDTERRAFFDLAPLPLGAALVIALVALGWGVALHWAWSRRLFERALGLADGRPLANGGR